MLISDPIGDLLTRVRNALGRKYNMVIVPYSRMLEKITDILKVQKYISDYKVEEVDGDKVLKIYLRYENKKSVITKLKRVSKPGLRKYVKSQDIPKILGGMGVTIVSTSHGVLTGEDARKEGVGGEYLCYIY